MLQLIFLFSRHVTPSTALPVLASTSCHGDCYPGFVERLLDARRSPGHRRRTDQALLRVRASVPTAPSYVRTTVMADDTEPASEAMEGFPRR